MRNWFYPAIVAISMAAAISATAGEKVAVYPLEQVSVEATTAAAIERSLSDELTGKGLLVVSPAEALTVETATAAAAETDETTEPSAVTPKETGDATAADAPKTNEADATSAESTPAAGPTTEGAPSLADRARASGARYYITGSIVRLGTQTTIALELTAADAGPVSAKKVVARNDAELPRAVQTIAAHMAQDVNRHVATTPTPVVQSTSTTNADVEQAPPAPHSTRGKFEKNFGLSISQAFSLKDEMYSFTSFNFNGRFEFSQLLLIVTAGFAMGNKDFEDGFHFNVDVSLAGYLTKTQVAPYLGGGLGLFIGNKLDPCPHIDDNDYDYDYYYDEGCSDDSIVGWEVFPVVGVEILRNFPVRLHVEARYLLAFNPSLDWGHGPMMVLGVAF